jgi:hypothetical protein
MMITQQAEICCNYQLSSASFGVLGLLIQKKVKNKKTFILSLILIVFGFSSLSIVLSNLIFGIILVLIISFFPIFPIFISEVCILILLIIYAFYLGIKLLFKALLKRTLSIPGLILITISNSIIIMLILSFIMKFPVVYYSILLISFIIFVRNLAIILRRKLVYKLSLRQLISLIISLSLLSVSISLAFIMNYDKSDPTL